MALSVGGALCCEIKAKGVCAKKCFEFGANPDAV